MNTTTFLLISISVPTKVNAVSWVIVIVWNIPLSKSNSYVPDGRVPFSVMVTTFGCLLIK